MTVASATGLEVLQFLMESRRAKQWLDALAAGATAQGFEVVRTLAYRGTTAWLLIWGPGDPTRAAVLQHHVAGGGRVIALDLAYWNRGLKVRVSIDAAHPPAWVMRRDWPRARWDANPAPVADTWRPEGPVIIAGLGPKARVQYGASTIDAWERSMITTCRARWPGRPVLYRRKRDNVPVPMSVAVTSDGPIESVLRGASLVVTWHSNVAVDAIRMGIPVICRDGAAAAVCPSDFTREDPQPLAPALRDRFLHNLAWFQWAPDEAPACWAFLQELLA